MIKSILHNKWLCFLYCCSLCIASASSQQQQGEEAVSQYVHDHKTTYCFKSSASIYESNVTREQILYQGSNDACPFLMTLTLDKQNVNIDEVLPIRWTISSNPAFISTNDQVMASVVDYLNLPLALDPKTQVHASIIHSNIHSCAFGTECDPFIKGQHNTDPTMNQIANFTIQEDDPTTVVTAGFSSLNEMNFVSGRKYSLLAHIILPGENPDTLRYDYAIFTTINVEQKVEQNISESQNKKGFPIELVIVAAIGSVVIAFGIAGLFVLFRNQRRKKKHNPDTNEIKVERIPLPTPSSNNYSHHHPHAFLTSPMMMTPTPKDRRGNAHGQYPSDWTGFYTSNDTLPPSILMDDRSTLEMLRASRKSSPTGSPQRHVADFTRDIAYWDVRLSASPITPRSGAFFTNIPSASSSPVEYAMLGGGADEVSSCSESEQSHSSVLSPPVIRTNREIACDSSEDESEIDM